MLANNLNYTYAIVWMLGLAANVFGTVLCIILSGQIAKPDKYPFCADRAVLIFMIIAFAAFQSGQNLAGSGGAVCRRHARYSDAPL